MFILKKRIKKKKKRIQFTEAAPFKGSFVV